jgi:hypothetical protein
MCVSTAIENPGLMGLHVRLLSPVAQKQAFLGSIQLWLELMLKLATIWMGVPFLHAQFPWR